jgi:putative phage-type endonuclease
MNIIECKNREEWLERRKHSLGASDVAAVLGANPWRSPLEVYADKIGLMPDKDVTEAMEWGLRLEPAIAEKYAEETKREVSHLGQYTIVQHPDYPWLHATLDRVVSDKVKGVGALEMKTTAFTMASEWAEEPPLMAQVQLQTQIGIAGYPWGSIAGLIAGRKFVWADLDADPDFFASAVEQTKAFWRRVELQDPPTPDETESATRALKALYPKIEREQVALVGSFIDTDEAFQKVKGEIGELKKKETLLKNQLIAAIGSAELGVLPNGIAYSYKSVHKAGYTVGEQDYRELRRVKPKGGK